MALHTHDPAEADDDLVSIRPQFTQSGLVGEVPRLRLPDQGMPPSIAYQVVHDELLLDGAVRLNLATFVTTWMEPEAELLLAECAAKNMIDKDEYPQTAELERRCVNMIAHLWHAPEDGAATGCSTTGSSEACMLGGLALLHRWRAAEQTRRRPAGVRPNLVLGANAQVCWEKFCRYFDVEARLVPVSTATPYLTAETAVAHCDEGTIGVVAILGSTYDGSYEPVDRSPPALDELPRRPGPRHPPPCRRRLGRVHRPVSRPGTGLGLPARAGAVDQRLGTQIRARVPGRGVGAVARRLGVARGTRVQGRLPGRGDAHLHAQLLPAWGPGGRAVLQLPAPRQRGLPGRAGGEPDHGGVVVGRHRGARPLHAAVRGGDIPAFAFRLSEPGGYSVYDVSDELRTRGWIVPAYTMPPAIDDTAVLRVVVRNGFSRDMAALFLADLRAAVDRLARRGSGVTDQERTGFHH